MTRIASTTAVLAVLASIVAGTAAAQTQACPTRTQDLARAATLEDSIGQRPVVLKVEGVEAGNVLELNGNGVQFTVLVAAAGSDGCESLGRLQAGTHQLHVAGTYYVRVQRAGGAEGSPAYSVRVKA